MKCALLILSPETTGDRQSNPREAAQAGQPVGAAKPPPAVPAADTPEDTGMTAAAAAATEAATPAAAMLAKLKSVCQELGQPVVTVSGCVPESFAAVEQGTCLLLAGSPDAEQLKASARQLRRLGLDVIIVADALEPGTGVSEAIDELADDRNLFQITVTGSVRALIKSAHPFVYAYAKADNTATLVVLFDNGQNVLAIKRKHAPFEGQHCLPGGFLKVHLESLKQCALREAEEETGVSLSESDLIAVDERSAPGRDPRGHIIDHGYLVVIPPERKDEVLSRIEARDDAAEAGLVPVCDLLSAGMAFDHGELLAAALKLVPTKPTP